jgi:hypothetical protein
LFIPKGEQMRRQIDIGKVVQLAGETKALNLDIPVRELVSSRLVDVVSSANEPWDLICADWITLIRKGPRLDSVLELGGLAESIRSSVGLPEQLAQSKGKAG